MICQNNGFPRAKLARYLRCAALASSGHMGEEAVSRSSLCRHVYPSSLCIYGQWQYRDHVVQVWHDHSDRLALPSMTMFSPPEAAALMQGCRNVQGYDTSRAAPFV
jgi:hypothetical protein